MNRYPKLTRLLEILEDDNGGGTIAASIERKLANVPEEALETIAAGEVSNREEVFEVLRFSHDFSEAEAAALDDLLNIAFEGTI